MTLNRTLARRSVTDRWTALRSAQGGEVDRRQAYPSLLTPGEPTGPAGHAQTVRCQFGASPSGKRSLMRGVCLHGRAMTTEVLSEVAVAMSTLPCAAPSGAVMSEPTSSFADQFRALIMNRGVSYRALASQTFYSKSYLHDLACGRKTPALSTAQRLDTALAAGGKLVALLAVAGIGRIRRAPAWPIGHHAMRNNSPDCSSRRRLRL
ncbi:helix-turn-helix domain-containing protein [Micromonospora sp. CA-249363]|uniref:helix-turn-helix domain-containing protein n=1 Tax=Micromonospora sp. CA-249363 TaxID=3239963 RepID=UPI003D8D4D91